MLHGTDGTRAIVEDQYGNLISETVVKEPVPGSDVRLTIDIDLQITAEDALADNIRLIREEADPKPGEHDGEDAHSGAVVALDPDTGALLAAASYPTYRLSDYIDNYAALAADENRPLYNRALLGTYTPGSTYKPGVAAAALSEGVITRNTVIVDKGVYDFGDYHPRCWIYLRFGRTHGAQTVIEAIQNSCNYFFYEVGYRIGIDAIDKYSRVYGLGEPTGIELPESTGILAGPAYSESTGNVWNPGNTLQAAIGQSDNMFTPLQLSVYISTLLSGGTRYRAHMLRSVHAYPSGEVLSETAPEVMSAVELDAGIVATVKSAMKDVVESGSAARIFRGYDITVGGKTGTAQVGGDRTGSALPGRGLLARIRGRTLEAADPRAPVGAVHRRAGQHRGKDAVCALPHARERGGLRPCGAGRDDQALRAVQDQGKKHQGDRRNSRAGLRRACARHDGRAARPARRGAQDRLSHARRRVRQAAHRHRHALHPHLRAARFLPRKREESRED